MSRSGAFVLFGQTLLLHHKNNAKYRVATLNSLRGRDLKQRLVGGNAVCANRNQVSTCAGSCRRRLWEWATSSTIACELLWRVHRLHSIPRSPPRAPSQFLINILHTMKQIGLGPRLVMREPRLRPNLVNSICWQKITEKIQLAPFHKIFKKQRF